MSYDKNGGVEVQEQSVPEITIQDISLTVATIDLCTQRGAFRGEELYRVGELREKMASVLRYHQAVSEQQQQARPSPISTDVDSGGEKQQQKAADKNKEFGG